MSYRNIRKPLRLSVRDKKQLLGQVERAKEKGPEALDRLKYLLKNNQQTLSCWRKVPLGSRGYFMRPHCAREILREQRAIRFVLALAFPKLPS